MLLSLVLAAAVLAPIAKCESGNDCSFAVTAWKAGWQPAVYRPETAAEKRLAERADARLMSLYPNEKAHRLAREADLSPLLTSLRKTEALLSLLKAERVPLNNEKEFYPNLPIPTRLQSALEENNKDLANVGKLAVVQRERIATTNAFFDSQLLHLKLLWSRPNPTERLTAGRGRRS